ncbi:MAG: DUF4340 domain-containing protein [Lentisphaerae bacterium]|nr:DUF4340 domain-containing protein [Lentisphaerota bacterium]
MKAKNLVILVVAAAVLVAAALWTQRSEEEPSDLIGRRVLADLPVNDIAQIVVTSAGTTTQLARVDGVWVSQSHYNYPADFTRIKAAILKLSELSVGQVVDVEAGDKPAMKMVSPTSGSAGAGTLVEMNDASETPIASLLIGEARKRAAAEQGPYGGYPDGQYVSTDKGATVYLIKDNLYEFDRAGEWLDKQLVSVTANDVTTAMLAGPDRDAVTLRLAEGTTDLVIAPLGEKEEMDTERVNTVKSALSYLRFESVADPTMTDSELGMETPATFTITTKKSEIYTVQIGTKAADSENRYARIHVALTPAPEVTDEGAPDQTDEEKEAASAERVRLAAERAAQEQTVAELNARLAPWTYVIASHKSDTMLSTRDQLVKDVEEEKSDVSDEEEPESEDQESE